MASRLMTRSRSNPNMHRSVYGISVILIVVFATLVSLNSSTAQRVNCRKFVFAPICRGTASKRAPPLILPSTDTEDDIYSAQDGKLEMEAEYPMMTVHEGEVKRSKIREILQRQRRRFRQMEQQPKAESFDRNSLYDY